MSAIQCGRESIVPAKYDYKVLQAGFPFLIVAPDGRMLVMELFDGRLAVSAKVGDFTLTETSLIQAYVNAAQEFFYRTPAGKKKE